MTGAERKALWRNYKYDAGCRDCGTRSGVLEFDHLPQHEKLFTISEAIPRTGLYGDAEIAAEVAKCEVVCAPCHHKRTSGRLR